MTLITKKAIQHILSAEFIVEVATPELWDGPPYREEEYLIKNSVEKRKREFCAGRACVRKALSQLAIHHYPLLADRARVPLWPENIIGSISHTDDCCVAVVAKKARLQGVGIDVEQLDRSVAEIETMVCVQEELYFLKNFNQEDRLKYLMLIFSAKESVYKALYPSMRIPFEFEDIRITINTCTEWFGIELLVDLDVFPKLTGRYFFSDKHVFTVCEYSI